jgi:guanine deaminase
MFKILSGTVIDAPTPTALRVRDSARVLIDGAGKILDIVAAGEPWASSWGSTEEARTAVETVLPAGTFLMPGLVDTHMHAPQYMFTGTGTDLPLLDWLNTYTFPNEARCADAALASRVYRAAVRRGVRNGTTTCAYFATIHEEATRRLVDEAVAAGQRAFVGKVCMDRNCPDTYREASAADSVAGTRAVAEYARSVGGGLVEAIVTPRFVPTCSAELMRGLGNLAKEMALPIQSHVSENLAEIAWVAELHPECASYTEVYDRYGLLTGRTILAHGCHLTDAEIALLAERGASIAHCANSNFTLGSGVLDVRRLERAGIPVGLGTDVSGGYAPSVLSALRDAMTASATVEIAARGGDGGEVEQRISYIHAFHLATQGGAKALGLGAVVGTIDIGKELDALIVHPGAEDGPIDLFEGCDSTVEAFQKFLLLGDDRNIKDVFVRGRSTAERAGKD